MMDLAQAARLLEAGGCACRIAGDPAARIAAVSNDTRSIAPGALYVALRGPRFDGHEFAQDAAARGAAAALVERPLAVALPQLVVADARVALACLAAGWRAQFSLPVIAVTGSNGKTTTTQMIASILSCAFGQENGACRWFATRGNRNNEIGVPLMLLELRAVHRAAVLELGMNHPGEIARLASWTRPDVALVTNAQREHQEFLDSVEATARENGAAIQALAPGGTAAFPADDPCAPIWRGLAAGHRVVDFAAQGAAPGAAVAAHIRAGAQECGLRLDAGGRTFSIELAVGGMHNARNALAAASACLAIGIEPDAIAEGLAAFRPVAGRGTRRAGPGGAMLIDDSYNANPDSVRAAIDLLASRSGRRVFILGDMAELGPRSAGFHAEVGAYARARGIDQLLALGPESRAAVQAFGPAGLHFTRVDDLVAAALGTLVGAGPVGGDGTTVLVKGSRSMRMERVLAALAADAPGAAEGPPATVRDHA